MRRIFLVLAAGASATALSGCETVAEATQPTFHADLTGAAEVPAPGDPDGRGSAELHIADPLDRICYEINVQNLVEVTVAHIHRGAAGVVGPPVVTLQAPTDGHSEDCEDINGALADEIEANPGAFYVNVHTRAHPDGAVRGQLRH